MRPPRSLSQGSSCTIDSLVSVIFPSVSGLRAITRWAVVVLKVRKTKAYGEAIDASDFTEE